MKFLQEYLYRLLGQVDEPYVHPPKDKRKLYFGQDEVITFNNDGLDVWIGHIDEWKFHTTHKEFRKIAIWYLYQWMIIDWFGLRSYIWYKLLNTHIRNTTPSKEKKMSKPIILTRREFEKVYGKCPDWMWDLLRQNYQDLLKEGKIKP